MPILRDYQTEISHKANIILKEKRIVYLMMQVIKKEFVYLHL
jgi:hypothetical protein